MVSHSSIQRVILLSIPVMVVLFATELRRVGGPYYFADNTDPAYAYLLNSTLAAQLQSPAMSQHPGATVFLTSAPLIRLTHLVTGHNPLPDDVLLHPELYLQVISHMQVAFYGLAILFVGWMILRHTGRLTYAICMQATPLMVCSIFYYIKRASPEPIMLIVGTVLVAAVFLYLMSDDPVLRRRWIWLQIAMVGLGMATKVTFAPLAILPLFAIKGWKSKTIYAVLSLVVFVLALFPVFATIDKFPQFMVEIIANRDLYRGQPSGQISLGEYLRQVVGFVNKLWVEETLFVVAMVVSVIAVGVTFVAGGRAGLTEKGVAVRRGLIGLIFTAAVAVLMAAKDPLLQVRYYLATLVLPGLAVPLILALIDQYLPKWYRTTSTVLVAMIVVAIVVFQIPRMWKLRLDLQRRAQDSLMIGQQIAAKHANCLVMTYQRASSPPFALETALRWTDGAFGDELRRIYPDHYSWGPAKDRFQHFHKQIAFDELRVEHDCVVFWGFDTDQIDERSNWVHLPKQYTFDKIYNGGAESLYRLVLPVTDTSANQTNPVSHPEPANVQAPNIVVIMADDLGAEQLGCYGHPSNKTPNLDELSRRGTRFETCWATPLCTPSRVEILTGRYGFRTGWLDNIAGSFSPPRGSRARHLGQREETFADVLKQCGYATALAGKWQLPRRLPSVVRDCGFDEYLMWAINPTSLPDGADYQGPVAPIGPSGRSITSRYWHPALVVNGQFLPATDQDYGPDRYTEFLIDFIRRNRDRSFLAYYPMCLPHIPYLPTPRSFGRHDRAGMFRLDSNEKLFQRNGSLKEYVQYLDHLVGRLMTTLEELDLTNRTIVIFTADNGTSFVNQGDKGKATELGVRVPLIVAGPGVLQGRTSRELVDLSDIFPTLAELADVPLPDDRIIDGQSFVASLRGETNRGRQWIFSYLRDQTMLRDHRWMLDGAGRFYDCGHDRTGRHYKDVSASDDPAVLAAKENLRQILSTLKPR